MGTVYQAWDTVLERNVALKALNLNEEGHPSHLSRFRREALTLAQLNHPNVCQVHDWLEWDGCAYIAMELIEGQTLSQASGVMDTKSKLKVILAVASALEVAHAKGIIHRDLKPSNVIVDSQGQVKVLDFGIARLISEENTDNSISISSFATMSPIDHGRDGKLTSPEVYCTLEHVTHQPSIPHEQGVPTTTQECLTLEGSFVGSPFYASPEQMLGRKTGPPSDIFSLGVLACNLLLGEHPFPGDGRERMEATINGKRISLRGRNLHRRIADLLTRMLAREPSRRPTATEVVAILNRYLSPSKAGWWIALAASLLGILGTTYMLYGRGILADLAGNRLPRLAVMPIRNETGKPSLNGLVEVGMTELLAKALRESPSLTVVDPESVTHAFSVLRLDPTQPLDPHQQVQVLRALGVGLVFQGSLKHDAQNNNLVFSFTLAEPSGKVRFAGKTATPAQQEFMAYALVDPATTQVLQKVDPLRSVNLQHTAAPAETIAKYAEGKALFIKGDYKGSEPLLLQAAIQAPAFAMAVTTYAACLQRLGRDKALDVANWALMSARATGDRWSESQTLGVKASLAEDKGDLDTSEQLYKSALILAQSLHYLDEEARIFNRLGLIAAKRNRNEEASTYYEQSLKLGHQISAQAIIALAQNNLANLSLKKGDLPRATKLYAGSLAIQRELGNHWGEATLLNNLGILALTNQDLAQAEDHLTKALTIRETVGDKTGQTTSLRNLGILNLMRGDLDQSARFHERALRLAQSTGTKILEAECSFFLGELHRLQLNYNVAIQDYHHVLEVMPKQVSPDIRSSAQAALAECKARSSRQVEEATRRLLEINPAYADSPYANRARAWIHYLKGELPKALEALDKAQADALHQAPDIQPELRDTRILFQEEAHDRSAVNDESSPK